MQQLGTATVYNQWLPPTNQTVFVRRGRVFAHRSEGSKVQALVIHIT